MRDHLLQRMEGEPVEERRNLAREYLQVYLLRLLHEAGANRALAFQGGTALRLLHRLPRFSEDLDFASIHGEDAPDPEALFREIKAKLENSGYQIGVRARTERAVVSAFFRFEGLPRALGWSEDPRLALAVKVEMDLRPPEGAGVETTLVQRFFPVAVRHHDLPSLFSGKLHALLARPWAKGRDWFDLTWYLTEKRGTEPNSVFLANALSQTGHDPALAARWRQAVRERLAEIDWGAVEKDVAPFLERPEDLRHISPGGIEKLLGAVA